jgi:signal transduction histidine kinase
MKSENEVFLRQKEYTKEEAREIIESNLEEVERLERLAKNLLELTKYEDVTLDLESAPIQDVITAAIERAKKSYPDRKFEVRVKNAMVLCQPDSLVELMGIIIDNACKYSPADKPITITGKTLATNYTISIADKGKGIEPVDLPYIFDRLYRGDKARSSSVSGHGLGLALAKRIANANHGSISASNARRGGAVFTITLHTR